MSPIRLASEACLPPIESMFLYTPHPTHIGQSCSPRLLKYFYGNSTSLLSDAFLRFPKVNVCFRLSLILLPLMGAASAVGSLFLVLSLLYALSEATVANCSGVDDGEVEWILEDIGRNGASL